MSENHALKNLPTEWDLTQFYPDEAAFKAAMDRYESLIPVCGQYRGKLNSKEGILAFITDPAFEEMNAIMNRALMYDTALEAKNAADPLTLRVEARLRDVDTKRDLAMAYVSPEILSLPLETRQEIFASPELAPYAYYYREFTDPETVVLSEQARTVESLLSVAAAQSAATHDVLDYVDLDRPVFQYPAKAQSDADEAGQSKKDQAQEGVLDDAVYARIIQSRDYSHEFKKDLNILRAKMRGKYENTYASMLDGAMKTNWALARIHGFQTTLAGALHDSDVDPGIYTRIIDSAHGLLPKVHEYYAAKKKLYGLEEMGLYDLNVPVTDYRVREISYEEAVNTGRQALAAWGEEYLSVFDRIMTNPLIDVMPGRTKRSGAFELLAGQDLLPMVLFNFDGTENYISTIVHEMGHAVYSQFAAQSQDRFNCDPGIFTQEVASTANEILFYLKMIGDAPTREEKIYWLDNEISLFLGTILRQCMYSEFEDYCYKEIEAGRPLSADGMDRRYFALCEQYYGSSIALPEEFASDWARVPHFYYNYYVYKYATSITYAAAVVGSVQDGKAGAVDDYIRFLKAGSSASPAKLLRIAGVDPLADETYDTAHRYICGLIDDFIRLTAE